MLTVPGEELPRPLSPTASVLPSADIANAKGKVDLPFVPDHDPLGPTMSPPRCTHSILTGVVDVGKLYETKFPPVPEFTIVVEE